MKLNLIFRKLSVFSALIVAGVCASQALAAPAPGTCERREGIKLYPFSFETIFDTPNQNTTGKIIENAAGDKWALADPYLAVCGCTRMNEAFFTGKSTLFNGVDYTDASGLTYYILDDFLSVASLVNIAGRVPKIAAVPFENVGNGNNSSNDIVDCSGDKNTYYSGAKGQINLRFRRPFVGVYNIPETTLVEVYMSSERGVTSPTPVSRVTMTGTVIVPQNCEISPQPVIVNFGNIASTDFQEKGAMPKNFTPHQRELTVACNNISDGVKVSLFFQGDADPNYPDALKSDNDDIAVTIKESSTNAVISPNDGRLPVVMDYSMEKPAGKTDITLYPFNTTGKMPAVGVFNSTATIMAEIQ